MVSSVEKQNIHLLSVFTDECGVSINTHLFSVLMVSVEFHNTHLFSVLMVDVEFHNTHIFSVLMVNVEFHEHTYIFSVNG